MIFQFSFKFFDKNLSIRINIFFDFVNFEISLGKSLKISEPIIIG